MAKDVTAFVGLESGSVLTLNANTTTAGGNDFTVFNITCEEAGWGGERFAELDLDMGEATRLRDMLDFLIKHEAAHALHKAKQQYNAAGGETWVKPRRMNVAADRMIISMTDELESQASSTPEQRKALRELITERAKEVRPDPKSQGAGKNPFANGNIRKWTNK
tara:strand:- start:233 stop:724 length:492 start_codon:yes stop_codon:yes gene_type:complete